MTRHLDLLEWRSKHLSVLAQTIPDPDMCRFGGIDALDRGYMAHHSSLATTLTSTGSYEGRLVAAIDSYGRDGVARDAYM